jgi:hypothetical protein
MKFLLLFFFVICSSLFGKTNLTDDQIKQQIIQESIASYRGSCPCPYNVARNGSQCGRRSAYSRIGGASPICYPEDVTQSLIRKYREKNKF